MKNSKLDRLIRETLLPSMVNRGFEYGRMTFFRECPSGVFHLMGLEFDPRTTETFRVLCGLCTRAIEYYKDGPPHNFAYIGAQHLAADGWSPNSGHWPCTDEQAARQSLAQVESLARSLVEPWFASHTSLSSVAFHLDTQHPRQGLEKAKLYLMDHNPAQAKKTLQEFLTALAHPKPWDDKNELAGYQQQAEALLSQLQ